MIICEIIVHLLVIVQSNKRCTVHSVEIKRLRVFTARYTLSPYIKQTEFVFKGLKPSVHYMYHQFNIQQFYVLPTHCIYVFCVELRT